MEKFSNWRDKGTGISPFMPVDSQPLGIAGRALQLLLVVAKLPIFVVVYLGYLTICPFASVANFLVVTLFGFRKVEVTADGVKKSRSKEVDAQRPGPNDVVVVNYVSPIDPLILASIAKVSWRNIYFLIPDNSGDLYEYSAWGAAKQALSPSAENALLSTEKVTDLSRYSSKLVYIFAEGTTSNNRSILPFMGVPAIEGLSHGNNKFTFKTVLLKISPNSFTTPLPLHSLSGYLFSLLANISGKSGVRAKIFTHQNGIDLVASKRSFELNQLTSVGNELDILLKEAFHSQYLKVKK